MEVRRESDNALVSLFSNRAGSTPLGNPFMAADGKVFAFVAGGAYRVVLTKGAYMRTLNYVPVGMAMELRFSSSGTTPCMAPS